MIVKFLFLLDFFGRGLYNVTRAKYAKYPARVVTVITVQFEVWLSLVERYVRDVEVVGSNPVTSTQGKSRVSDYRNSCFFVLWSKLFLNMCFPVLKILNFS